MDRYIKIFLTTGIPFGLVFGTFYHMQRGFPAGLIAGLIGGMFVGSTLSLILGFLHRRSVKQLPYEDYEDALEVKQERRMVLPLSYDKTFNLCIESLKEIKRASINKLDRSQGRIVGRTGMSSKTLGERIIFKVESVDEEKTSVYVLSEPVSPTTAVDYGKNLENVERISAFLEGQMEA